MVERPHRVVQQCRHHANSSHVRHESGGQVERHQPHDHTAHNFRVRADRVLQTASARGNFFRHDCIVVLFHEDDASQPDRDRKRDRKRQRGVLKLRQLQHGPPAHDGGRTFKVIQNVLTNELGYTVSFKVIDSRYWVPQSRKRIYIIGIESVKTFDFEKLRTPNDQPVLGSILHPQNGSEAVEQRFTYGKSAKVLPKYTLGDGTWEYLQKHAELHKQKGNGFGYGIFDKKGVARTLSSRYYKDGSEILIRRGNGQCNPRRLTPRECARLMGFPDDYKIVVSDTQAYRQFGNSVVVPVVSEIAKKIVPFLA